MSSKLYTDIHTYTEHTYTEHTYTEHTYTQELTIINSLFLLPLFSHTMVNINSHCVIALTQLNKTV